MAPARTDAAARQFFFEALAAHSLPRPGYPRPRPAGLGINRELGQYIRDSEGDMLRRDGRSRNLLATAGAKQHDDQRAFSTERPFSWRNRDSWGA